MRPRLARPLLATVGSAILLGAFAAPANAATVRNRFHRTCTWWSCSPYVQVNGAYQPSGISNCVTYSWWGTVASQYLRWGRC